MECADAKMAFESRMRRWLWLAPVLLGFLCGSAVLGNRFLADDDILIVTNPLTHSLEHLGTLLTGDFFADGAGRAIGYYRPLTRLAFALEYAGFGASPAAFHAVSLIAFLVSVVLVGRLARALGFSQVAAVIVAGFYASHPVQAGNIGVVAAQSDVFMSGAVMAALLAFRHARRTGKVRWLGLAACGQLLAVGFKETGLVAALLAIAWELLDGRRPDRKRRLAVTLLTFGAPVVAAMGLRVALGITTPLARDLGPMGLLGLGGKLAVGSLLRTLVPVAWTSYLESAWPGPQPAAALPWALGALGLLGVSILVAWRKPGLRHPLVWLWLPLVPILVLPGRVAMVDDGRVFVLADRWLLLSVVGAGGLWVTCGEWLWTVLGRVARLTLAASAACVLLLHAILARGENASMRSEETRMLWVGAALESKSSRTAVEEEWYLASRAVLADRGRDLAASTAIYRSLLQLRPWDFAARYNLAAALYEEGSIDEALEHAWATYFGISRDGRQVYPRNDSFYRYRAARALLLGLIFERKGEREVALRFFHEALALDPQQASAKAHVATLER